MTGNRDFSPIVRESSGQHPRAPLFLFLTASQRCDAFTRANTYLCKLYFAIVFSVIFFDLGGSDYGKILAEFGQSIIPSIRPTSQLTSQPESVALVLSIGWMWGIVISLPLLWLLAKDGRGALNIALLRKTFNPLGIAFIWVMIPCEVFIFATELPDKLLESEGFILRFLEATPYSMVLWGAVNCFHLSLLIYMFDISLVCALTGDEENS